MKLKILKSIVALAITAIPFMVFAQSGITSIHTQSQTGTQGTTYTSTGAPGSSLSSTTYTYHYGATSNNTEHSLLLNSIQAGGTAYAFENIPLQVFFRRVNNSNVSTERDLMFYFGALSQNTFNLKAPYEPNMQSAFIGNTNLLRGSDNLFANSGDGSGNINNIERLDVIAQQGLPLVSASGQGFVVMERGAENQHDPFVVAVITSLDGAGKPSAYSTILRINSTHYGTVNVIPNQPSVVLRRNTNATDLQASTTLSGQGIGGIFFKFSDFGLTDGQTIYGYSLAAADFPTSGTPSNFLDYNNSAFFPLNTNGAGPGGIDMIALTGFTKKITLAGNVFHDTNGMSDNLVNGNTISQINGAALFINLINSSNQVIQSVAVQNDGSFSFSGLPFGNFRLELSSLQGIAGSIPPAVDLQNPEWVYTGTTSGNGATAMNLQGYTEVSITSGDINGIGFGIQQRPTTANNTTNAVVHPGEDILFSLPSNAFIATDPDGIVSNLKIIAFPANATQIVIDGISYNASNFPIGGVIVPTDPNGQPNVAFTVAAVANATSIEILFKSIDNAGAESNLSSTTTIPLSQGSNTTDNLFPATGFGTLAFEDLWPGKGDYDFNDLVIDYQFQITSNAGNYVQTVEANFVIKAFGASFENGFGFQFGGISPDKIQSVSGQQLTENIISLSSNGTEAGQSKATFVLFDNAFSLMPHPGIGIGVNTTPEAPYVQPVSLAMTINFKPNEVSLNDLNIGNFNPFLIVNKVRSHEVHLPNYPPTDLADVSLFGQWEDASNPAEGKFYITANNLLWAINIYESFAYPIEKQEILWAHLKFAEWAMSGGVQFPDWYKNLTGYRNSSLIYQVPSK
jgi:LruC domain-containing protein